MTETIGIVGYGNQGRAHALNLRDRGHGVRIGVRPGGAGEARARADAFVPEAPAGVARSVDILSLLLPDQALPSAGAELAAELRAGGALVFAHGSALAFGAMTIPAGRDAVLVAPSGPGTELRRAGEGGTGLPAVLAVHTDASGRARERASAYAAGIACDVDRSLWVGVEEEAVVDLFGEQVVLLGGLTELVGRAFETLVDAGFPPELAHLECVEQLRLTTALISEHGIDGTWDRVSATAAYGALETGPQVVGDASTRAMREALERVRSGAFFRDFIADHEAGGARLRALRRQAFRETLERAGRAARARQAAQTAKEPPQKMG